MKTYKKFLTMLLCVGLLLCPNLSSAHSGRTDSSGGHHDYNNKSGLGSYHYHHGMGPHLHKNGVCPYSSSHSKKSTTTTNKVSKYYQTSTIVKVQKKLNKLGYKCGKADGVYGTKTKNSIKKFQRKKGLTVDGKINKNLLKKLTIKI